MKVAHTNSVRRTFKVLQTQNNSQIATMILKRGEDSGVYGNEHPESEQIVYVVRGELVAHISGKRRTLKAGDAVIVPRRAKHRFVNKGKRSVVTFNVYAPPAYDENEEQ